MNGIERGDIFYVESFQTEGSEQRPGRPAIVVSNPMCNEFSDVVEVVYLTTRPKADLPTHVTIRSAQKPSIAICEQITSVAKNRLGNWMARVSDEEMRAVDVAMMISLALEPQEDDSPIPAKHPEPAAAPALPSESELVLRTQRDTYKALYEDLLGRLMPAAGRSA